MKGAGAGDGGGPGVRHAPPQHEQSLLETLWSKNSKVVVAGGLAGAVSKTCTAPLARLTILYQVQGFEGQAPSLAEALRRVIASQGIRSLWKGHLATLLHRIPYSAINFTVYEESLARLSQHFPSKAEGGTLSTEAARYLIAGGLGGGSACAVAYPLDLVRTRLAAQLSGDPRYRGIAHALWTIVRQEGVTGLYKGLGATLLQVTPTLAINFCAYELLKTWVAHKVHHQSHPAALPGGSAAQGAPGGALAAPAALAPARHAAADDANWWESKAFVSLLAGSLSGMVSSTVTFPLDLIRRNLQMGKGSISYAGVVRSVYAKGGLRGFYAGIIPEYFKVVPGVSIAFCTYEVLKELLGVQR